MSVDCKYPELHGEKKENICIGSGSKSFAVVFFWLPSVLITGKNGVRSPKFIWASCAQLYLLAEAPQPSPPHLGSYTRALLVCQDRRHLLVIPWFG